MIRHLDDDQLLSAAFDDVMAGRSAHVEACTHCRALVDDLRVGARLVRAAQGSASIAHPPPPPLRQRVLDSIRPQPTRTQGAVHSAPRWPWALAAAVALAVGVGIGSVLDFSGGEPTPVTVAVAELEPLADDATPAGARVSEARDGLVLIVEAPAFQAKEADYFEVWLINEDLERMVSVGILGTDGEQRFPVTQELLDEGYRIVDISREFFDGAPTHSGDSLVRGELTD